MNGALEVVLIQPIVSDTSINLVGHTTTTHMMTEIFIHDIAVSFVQTWYAQAVESRYLSSNMLPEVA